MGHRLVGNVEHGDPNGALNVVKIIVGRIGAQDQEIRAGALQSLRHGDHLRRGLLVPSRMALCRFGSLGLQSTSMRI